MTAKAKSLSLILTIVAAPWGVATLGLAGRSSWSRQGSAKSMQETDAAYRDGFFWGELDAQHGKKAQPSIARWNNDKDRASFRVGYEKGYKSALNSKSALSGNKTARQTEEKN
jgi:hypothetical protein